MTKPDMCLGHLDLVLLIGRVRQTGQPVTLSAVLAGYRALDPARQAFLSINPATIPVLMAEMAKAGAPVLLDGEE